MSKALAIFVILLSAWSLGFADQTTVAFDSGSQTLGNQSAVPLSGGSPTLDGDGDVLQLGYYSAATTANNFLGTWIPLSGAGSANTAVIPQGNNHANPQNITYNQTSTGDLMVNGAGNATFAISLDFVAGNATSGIIFR